MVCMCLPLKNLQKKKDVGYSRFPTVLPTSWAEWISTVETSADEWEQWNSCNQSPQSPLQGFFLVIFCQVGRLATIKRINDPNLTALD
jgi:hypothetical protein